MTVRYHNAGTYIPYLLEGTRLSFPGAALTVELAARQHDWPVELDISRDAAGNLVLGEAERYVAQMRLPALSYTIVKGKTDDLGFPQLDKVAQPLDTERVLLTLWALEV